MIPIKGRASNIFAPVLIAWTAGFRYPVHQPEVDANFWKEYLDDRPEQVDRRPNQTPLMGQGDRCTCITIAAITALEGAYLREGYGEWTSSKRGSITPERRTGFSADFH